MAIWNPWRGCQKCSEGCLYCYIHRGDTKRNVDTTKIVKTDKFDLPIQKNKTGEYRLRKPGQIIYLCFSSDFLLAEVDKWRLVCFKMIKTRSDLNFLFLTKRIERFTKILPDDWGGGYNNVIVGVSVENQKTIDAKISILKTLPIKHKMIICQPLLESVDLSRYLEGIKLVVVGGESGKDARPLNYDWVLAIREQCIAKNVPFEFRQCGTNFIKDGKLYVLPTKELIKQAKAAKIDYLTEKVLKN